MTMWHKKEKTGREIAASSEQYTPATSPADYAPYEYQRATNDSVVSPAKPAQNDGQPKNYFAD
jgi:hypothetical protein